jgi:hypothetical protein
MVSARLGILSGRCHGKEAAAESQLLGTMAVGEKAVMPDAMEPVGQGVKQKAPDELEDREGHHLRLAVVTIVLPAEADAAIGHADQARIGDRDAMRVAPEIGQHLLGPAKGWFGIDDPLDATELGEAPGEGGWLPELGKLAEEA